MGSFSQLVLAEAGFFADTMPETQENQFGKTRCRYKQHLLCQRVIRRYNANRNNELLVHTVAASGQPHLNMIMFHDPLPS